jgi:hypothetical protein
MVDLVSYFKLVYCFVASLHLALRALKNVLIIALVMVKKKIKTGLIW